ncbi:hypothetical protein D3C81_1135890 [compost metagenome]
MLFIPRQALLQVLGKGVGTDVAKYINMAVVAVFQALQGAILLHLVEKFVDLVKQTVVIAGGHCPALVARIAQVEGNPYLGEVNLVHRQLIGVDQGQIDLTFIDHAQQVNHLDGVRLFVFECRILLFQFCQLFGMGAALEHHDLLADQVFGIGRPRATVAVDNLRGDFQVRMGEAYL